MRSRGIRIIERLPGEDKSISKKLETTFGKRKSSELYKSIDAISKKQKTSKKTEGVGIYTIHNTNAAIINVSKSDIVAMNVCLFLFCK